MLVRDKQPFNVTRHAVVQRREFRASLAWLLTAVVWASVTILLVSYDASPSYRAPVALGFALVCPGLALVRPMRLPSAAERWALAVALSISLDTLVPSALVYSGHWSALLTLWILVGITLSAAVFEVVASMHFPAFREGYETVGTTQLIRGSRPGAPAVVPERQVGLGPAVAFYMLAIVEIQLTLGYVDLVAGIVAYAILIVVLLNHYAFIVLGGPDSGKGASTSPDALLALGLVPFVQIVVHTVPISGASALEQQLLVAGPVLPAVALAVWMIGLPTLRTLPRRWLLEINVAYSGVPLGLGAYLLLRGDGLVSHARASTLLAGSLVACLPAVIQEVTFRGLIQTTFRTIYPRSAWIWSSVLFAASYLGERPLSFVGFIAVVGLLFGFAVQVGHSLVGVIAAHVFLSTGLLVVWPLLA